MDEQPTTEPGTTEPGTTDPGSGGGGSEFSDPDVLATKIANAMAEKLPTFETIEGTHGDELGEFRVTYDVTLGDLLVSFLLCVAIALHLLKWTNEAIWRR